MRTRALLLAGGLALLGLRLLVRDLPSPQPPRSPNDDRVLRIAIPDDVETVDPPFSHFQISNEVNFNLYDQFFAYGFDESSAGYRVHNPGRILGAAVESWRTSADEKTVVLNLRREARFAKSGNSVTADDFIYWFDRAKALKAGTWFNIKSADIEEWEKSGDYEVTLRFRKPNPFFFFLFRDQSQSPAEKAVLTRHADQDDPWSTRWAARNDAGSGAYFVEKWIPGVELTLRANPHYWRGPAFFQTVRLYIVPSSAGRALLLARGAVDIAEQLSPLEIDNLGQARGVKITSVPTRNQYLVGLNNTQSPFTSKLVRQALAYAVPYDTIVEDVFSGQALKSRSPIPIKGQFHDGSLWPYGTDFGKAKALLKAAGFPHGFSLTLAVASGDPTAMELAVNLQSSLRNIGVSMKIDPQTAAVFAERLDRRSHQAWLRDLLLYVDDPGYMGAFHYRSTAILNWMAYNNSEVDRLFDEINRLWRPQDREQREQLCKQVQKLIIEDAPVLYLAEPNFNLAMRDNIEGYVHQPDNLLWYYPLRRK
jgi:peptide/nickel transport system substrate-binding protein